MRRLIHTLFIIFLVCSTQSYAEDSVNAVNRISKDLIALNLGFDEYFLGRVLTPEQKKVAAANTIEKTIKGSYKFVDNGVYVIANKKNDMVIGIYKKNLKATKEDVRNIVGEAMMQFDEPTTMAHDKLIYWVYDKNGRITQKDFDQARSEGGSKVLATINLSSSNAIRPTERKVTDSEEKKKEDEVDELTEVYIMITSNTLSKIFLAENR